MRLPVVALALALPALAGADPALDADEVEFVRLINEYRAANGLDCLSVSPTANVASDYMSRAMGEQGFFSHNEPPCDPTGSECTGRNPFQRMRDLGHDGFDLGGENIAAGQPNAATVFESWRNSPGHNANMLTPGFTAMGIAKVEVPGSHYGVYWTNNFSDRPDGTHDCHDGLPEVGYGAGAGAGGGGGSGGGGAGGEAGSGGTHASGGKPWWMNDEEAPPPAGDGGCASTAGLPSLLAAALVLHRLRRRG